MWDLNVAGLSSTGNVKEITKGERKRHKQAGVHQPCWVGVLGVAASGGRARPSAGDESAESAPQVAFFSRLPKWPSPLCSSGHQMLTFHSLSVHYFPIALMLSGFRVHECVCVHVHKKAKGQLVVLTSGAVRSPLPWRQSFV